MSAMKADAIHRAYGTQVKRLRQLLGLSQGAFGKPFNWTQATVSDIEIGKRKLTVDEVDALADWAAPQLDGWSRWDVVLFIHSRESFRPAGHLSLVDGDGSRDGSVGSERDDHAKGGQHSPETELKAVSGL